MKNLIAALCLALVIPAQAAPKSQLHVYSDTGLKAVRKIGSDLYETLDERRDEPADWLDAPAQTL